MAYFRKRTNKKVQGTYAIRLEELAKIRYTFNVEPTRASGDPKSLWTLKADNGYYEDALGMDGENVGLWLDKEFGRMLLAICLFRAIE
jgi:hypothetical protein